MAKVLLIEDSAHVRVLVCTALQGAGHDVLAAGDGEEALQMLARVRFDLVLCDVNLPGGVDGFAILQTLRQSPAHERIPCLMLTGESRPGCVARAKQAGAQGWFVKPYKVSMLISAVSKLVSSERQQIG